VLPFTVNADASKLLKNLCKAAYSPTSSRVPVMADPNCAVQSSPPVEFRTGPNQYRHWTVSVEGRLATLTLNVDEKSPLVDGYELKLNSYDLGVDIELYDATQRLRFEHPEVGAVIVTSGKDRVFSAGANIRMLAQSSHAEKVNFCKFTNETRIGIEDASENSGQTYLCAINGACAGGGYELALAAHHLMLIDDGSSTVSLPEVALLGVLPGTGGLTRLTDKRLVRHDIADHFCTLEEGVGGKRALRWRLVDELIPSSQFHETVSQRAQELAGESRPETKGISLTPLDRQISDTKVAYRTLEATLDRIAGTVEILIKGPHEKPPAGIAAAQAQACKFWPLALVRELDDLFLHLRHNEAALGTWVVRSRGECALVAAYDSFLNRCRTHWFAREVQLYWKRLLRRYQLSARSLFVLIDPGSCFAGTLLEFALGADRSFMLDGPMGDDGLIAKVQLTNSNFGTYPTINGLTRLESRFLDTPEGVATARQHLGLDLEAEQAEDLRLVTFTPDDIDWEDEIRIAIEERSGFSPDALTGLEANLRCPGPETMESKIFARLSAWQNWIFQRPNATGDAGALALYGSGKRAGFDRTRT